MRYKGGFLVHTTNYGYVNKNSQMNIGRTEEAGTDYMQVLYKMECQHCKQ